MWDERIVEAIVSAAREDLRAEKWARDFSDKLKQRNITVEMIERAIVNANAIVIYRHGNRYVMGFYHELSQILSVWSPRRPSKWVTSFRHPKGLRYLLRRENAEAILIR